MRGQYVVARPRAIGVVDDDAFGQPRSDEFGNDEAVADAMPATSEMAPATEPAHGVPRVEGIARAGKGEEIPRYGWFG